MEGWQFSRRLVEVLLSGAFVLAFTTIAGAVWFAGELRGVGLTGSEAISALPRSALLTKGADQLIPFALVAAGLTAAVWFLGQFLEADEEKKRNTRTAAVAILTACVVVGGGVGSLFIHTAVRVESAARDATLSIVVAIAIATLLLRWPTVLGIGRSDATKHCKSGRGASDAAPDITTKGTRPSSVADAGRADQQLLWRIAACFVLAGGVVLLLRLAGPPRGHGVLGWICTHAIVVICAAIVFNGEKPVRDQPS